MPVRFKGVSEYSNSFKWSPSFRSAKFQPTNEQVAPEAGLRSDQMNLLLEPTFARKRQVPHRRPEAQSLMMWFEDADLAAYSDEVISMDGAVEEKTYVVAKKSPAKEKKQGKVFKKQTMVNQCSERVVKAQNKKESVVKRGELKKDKPVDTKANKVLESSTQTEKLHQMKSRKIQTEPKKVLNTPSKKSSPKSPSKEIPLKYRPRRMRYTSAHQSEYQQMYRKPSRFVPSSPLISALDVVHTSSQAIPPHKSPRMPMKSEYESKFQNMSPLSKSLPAFSSPTSPSLKLKVKNLPTSPLQVHRSPKRVASVYAKEFAVKEFPAESQERLWEDANHNKLNRDGCNFDKSHSIQLMSPKNKYWDLSSSTSVATESNTEKEIQSNESVAGSDVDLESVESVISMEQDSLATGSINNKSNASSIGEKPVARKLAWGESSETVSDGEAADDDTVTGTDADNTFEGRLPTPQLKQLGGALRTHHDLTTPCAGGALLSSPPASPRSKTYPQPRFQKLQTVKSPNETPVKEEREKNEDKKPHDSNAPVRCTKQVKPTSASKKTTSPKLKGNKSLPLPRRLIKSPRAPIQGSLRDKEFQHFGRNTRPSSIDQVSITSSRSSACASELLERSLQRKDFWQK